MARKFQMLLDNCMRVSRKAVVKDGSSEKRKEINDCNLNSIDKFFYMEMKLHVRFIGFRFIRHYHLITSNVSFSFLSFTSHFKSEKEIPNLILFLMSVN